MYNECRHIFTSGKKCQSPALQDQSFCYFHSNTRKRPARNAAAYEPYIAPQDTAHNLPQLEDADAIQLALSDVVLALAANRIDPRRARILIYGLQVASQNLRHRRVPQVRGAAGAANLGSEDIAAIVRETHQHEDGTLIGPAKQSPDPEEVAERKRPPSLGELLLAELEARKAQRIAEEEVEAAKSTGHAASIELPIIQAVADTPAQPTNIHAPWNHSVRNCAHSPHHSPQDVVLEQNRIFRGSRHPAKTRGAANPTSLRDVGHPQCLPGESFRM